MKGEEVMTHRPQPISNEEEVQRLLKAQERAEESEGHAETDSQTERAAARSHEATDRATDHGHQKTDQAADTLQDVAEKWREGVHETADRGHHLADKAADAVQDKTERGRQQAHAKAEEARHRSHAAQEQGRGKVDEAKARARHAGAQSHAKADSTMTSTGERMEHAAHEVRERSPEGQAGRVAGRAADTMEQGGRYLQDSSPNDVRHDLEYMIRKHPVESLLVGAGIGFLFARVTRRR
jgi:ElaB/YqjD/DUF883 family membrane-anchored ribosome-binding protein